MKTSKIALSILLVSSIGLFSSSASAGTGVGLMLLGKGDVTINDSYVPSIGRTWATSAVQDGFYLPMYHSCFEIPHATLENSVGKTCFERNDDVNPATLLYTWRAYKVVIW